MIMSKKIKASCIVAVVYHNRNHNKATIINHTGGIYGEVNTWIEELDNSDNVHDIFYNYELPPDKPGFYVWEGELEPVYEDQPNFYGEWRKATKEDMRNLIPDKKESTEKTVLLPESLTAEDRQAIEYSIQEIEDQEFENVAGSITKSPSWQYLKKILGYEKVKP